VDALEQYYHDCQKINIGVLEGIEKRLAALEARSADLDSRLCSLETQIEWHDEYFKRPERPVTGHDVSDEAIVAEGMPIPHADKAEWCPYLNQESLCKKEYVHDGPTGFEYKVGGCKAGGGVCITLIAGNKGRWIACEHYRNAMKLPPISEAVSEAKEKADKIPASPWAGKRCPFRSGDHGCLLDSRIICAYTHDMGNDPSEWPRCSHRKTFCLHFRPSLKNGIGTCICDGEGCYTAIARRWQNVDGAGTKCPRMLGHVAVEKEKT